MQKTEVFCVTPITFRCVLASLQESLSCYHFLCHFCSLRTHCGPAYSSFFDKKTRQFFRMRMRLYKKKQKSLSFFPTNFTVYSPHWGRIVDPPMGVFCDKKMFKAILRNAYEVVHCKKQLSLILFLSFSPHFSLLHFRHFSSRRSKLRQKFEITILDENVLYMPSFFHIL